MRGSQVTLQAGQRQRSAACWGRAASRCPSAHLQVAHVAAHRASRQLVVLGAVAAPLSCRARRRGETTSQRAARHCAAGGQGPGHSRGRSGAPHQAGARGGGRPAQRGMITAAGQLSSGAAQGRHCVALPSPTGRHTSPTAGLGAHLP